MEVEDHYSGSPYLTFLGTNLEEWRDGYACIGLVLQPHHLNRSGVVHGGVLAALLDHSCGFSGLYCTVPVNRRYGMTLSLTSNYLAQEKAGKLVAIGERIRSGKSIYHARSEVRTESGVVLAAGTGVFRYRSGSERPQGVAPRVLD